MNPSEGGLKMGNGPDRWTALGAGGASLLLLPSLALLVFWLYGIATAALLARMQRQGR